MGRGGRNRERNRDLQRSRVIAKEGEGKGVALLFLI